MTRWSKSSARSCVNTHEPRPPAPHLAGAIPNTTRLVRGCTGAVIDGGRMQQDLSRMEAEVASLVERGFRAIKVKVGVGVEADVRTLRAVRRVRAS